MKTHFSISHRVRKARGGFAVLIVLILLGIMVVFVAANTATVNWLKRQVTVVDQHQTRRLALVSTNELHNVQSITNPPSSK
jgi:hypothetical protein